MNKDNKEVNQLKSELSMLRLELHSSYGAYGQITPPLERQREIYDKISEINEELKSLIKK